MDPSLMRALLVRPRRRRRKVRRRRDWFGILTLVSTEVAITVTQTVILSQRLVATGPLATARYRR